MNRKDFLSLPTKAAVFLGLSSTAISCKEETVEKTNNLLNKTAKGTAFGLKAAKIDNVRVGIIGAGNRGQTLIQMFDWLVKNNNATIVAISDLKKEKTDKLNAHLQKTHGKTAEAYFGNPDEWKKVADRDDIDLLIIATPWQMHTPMALYGMEKGKHVASEVPIGTTLDDCWKLVETAERTQKHCMMMENCCFNNEELWVLNMVNQGVFGLSRGITFVSFSPEVICALMVSNDCLVSFGDTAAASFIILASMFLTSSSNSGYCWVSS